MVHLAICFSAVHNSYHVLFRVILECLWLNDVFFRYRSMCMIATTCVTMTCDRLNFLWVWKLNGESRNKSASKSNRKSIATQICMPEVIGAFSPSPLPLFLSLLLHVNAGLSLHALSNVSNFSYDISPVKFLLEFLAASLSPADNVVVT